MHYFLVFIVALFTLGCQQVEIKSQNLRAKSIFDQAVSNYQQQDYLKAFPLFEQANQLGHMKANRYIGLIYLNGYGVNVDPQKAFHAFHSAAEKGGHYLTILVWLSL